MNSAFGVDHGGVRKSFVPGGGFKRAKGLTEIERHIVRNKAQGNRAMLRQGQSQKPSAKGRKIWEGIETKRGKLNQVMASRTQTGAGPHIQGFSNPDGRGGGRVVIHTDADFKTTARHEMAHIKPKRNPVTMQARLKNPERLGREEGRADFLAHGKQSTGSYPGDDTFKRGYNETQGRMAAAKWRKDRK